MTSQTEVPKVELSVEDATVAIRSYEIVGYRVVGLRYEGAYAPEQEEDGSLLVDRVGAAALNDCLVESINYNQGFLYGKWEQVWDTESKEWKESWKQGLIDKNLKNQKIIPPKDQLENLWNTVKTMEANIEQYKQVRNVLGKFLAQEVEGLAA